MYVIVEIILSVFDTKTQWAIGTSDLAKVNTLFLDWI